MATRLLEPAVLLSAQGDTRDFLVREAASALLETYRDRGGVEIPPNMARIAATLGTRIKRVRDLEGVARLVPTGGGFLILVSDERDLPRFRAAVAHELVHTLFYDRSASPPRRLVKSSPQEEHFCFDVARRILVPDSALEASGVRALTSAGAIFRELRGQFRISREIAARLLMADYELAIGVAGKWTRTDNRWVLDKTRASASPRIERKERAQLRQYALDWLLRGVHPPSELYRISAEVESGRDSAWVLVERVKFTPSSQNSLWADA